MKSVDLTTLHCLFGVAGKPAYVKAASEQVHHTGVGPQACADGLGGQFPCDSRDATYVSAMKIAAAKADGENVADLEASLLKFAAFWQIEDDVRSGMAKIAEHLAPVQIEDSDYALCETYRGQPIRKFAAYDPGSTAEAASAFYDNRHRYPLAWRQKTARALIKKARAHGADIEPHVETYLFKAAGFGFPTQDGIENGLVSRLNHLSPRCKTAGEKLAAALGAVADSPQLRYNHDLVTDLLEITDRFDREMKLASHYDTDVELPEEMLEITTPMVKKAGAVLKDGIVGLQNGQDVNIHYLSKEALEAAGEGLSRMTKTKLASVLPTLPVPDANVLCKAAGIVKTAADTKITRPGLPDRKKVPPSPGQKAIGQPPSNADLAKEAQMAPPPPAGADPMAGAGVGAMPGPGAIPGAPAPGGTPMPGEGGAPEAAPNLPTTPGQASKPGQEGAGDPPGTMDPDASAGVGGAAPESGMAPDAAPAMPMPQGPQGSMEGGGGGGAFDAPDILDDPSIMAGASPSAEGPAADANLLAGAAAEDDASGMPGEPAGIPTPAAAGVMQDDVSGIPATVPPQ